ncbi:hypothetical protein QUG02_11055 [Bacillus hominis]|uniref:Uncharacterized protein n=1 Tax=Bacillus hominis TaxID=2817478 RepID=A0ABT7R7S5_9BACI|nr:hypothetical protein [Bacillus hominis]MDM5193515.1 hypothetical protein [Bacillus hominis]MDM5433237.1 hypothetical protein [Bacillus hominis]MDM5438659.1 hypothetical protein [Bacillus hominis]
MNQIQELYRVIHLQMKLMDITYALDNDPNYKKEDAVQELLELIQNLDCEKTHIQRNEGSK